MDNMDDENKKDNENEAKTEGRGLGFADALYAIYTFLLGYLYFEFYGFNKLGAGVLIYTLTFVIGTGLYFIYKKVKIKLESVLYLAIVISGAAYFMLYSNILIEIIMVLVIFLFSILWIANSNNALIGNGISKYILGDAINTILVIPFSNFGKNFSKIKNGTQRNKRGREVSAAILGVVIMIPVIVIVVGLLVSADERFEQMVDCISDVIEINSSVIWKAIFAVPVGCLIGGEVFGCMCGERSGWLNRKSEEELMKNLKIAPRPLIYSALCSINSIYVLFIVSQFSYLFDSINGVLPEKFTYADYARRGFFEICIITAINIVVLVFAHMLIEESGKEPKSDRDSGIHGMLKVQSIMLCIFTFLLIGAALSKMIMYIDVYGLTYLRTYASWFMIFMFLVVVVVIIRQFTLINIFKPIILGGAILVIVLGYINIDGFIANYNISRYLNAVNAGDKKADIDLECLADLDDGAAPYLEKLYNDRHTSQDMKDDIAFILCDSYRSYNFELKNISFEYEKKELFRSYNRQTYIKRRIRDKILKEDYDNTYLNGGKVTDDVQVEINQRPEVYEENTYSNPLGDISFNQLAYEQWEDIYFYVYYENEQGAVISNAEWPGVHINSYKENVYFYDIPEDMRQYDLYVIFNNGLGGYDNQYPTDKGFEWRDGDKRYLDENREWINIQE